MNPIVKTILVPIDFRVASLNTLKLALENSKADPVRAILLYAERLTGSITDLLFYSPDKIISNHLTPEFKEALEVLKNRYGAKLSGVEIKVFHGQRRNAMNDFLEANQVDEIFVPMDYQLKTPHRAFDPIPLIKYNRKSVHEMEWSINTNQSEQEHLTALFN